MKNSLQKRFPFLFLLFATLFLLGNSLAGFRLLAAESKRYTAGDVWFTVESLWREVPVTSRMRQFQFRVPRVENDPEDAEMIVFYFGPDQGGTVEDNIRRWVRQFKAPEEMGGQVKPEVIQKTVHGLDVTVVWIQGIYFGGMGMEIEAPKPDYAFLCVIAQGPQGPVFFKLIGPRKTVEQARPPFDRLVDSLRL